MKVVCFIPDKILDFKKSFFIEMNASEYEEKLKPLLNEDQISSLNDIYDSEFHDLYCVFLYFNRIAQHEYEMCFHPSIKTFPRSAMNNHSLCFLDKTISTFEEIRNFYKP